MRVRVKNGGKKIDAYPTPYTNEALRDAETIWTDFETGETYKGEEIVLEQWTTNDAQSFQEKQLELMSKALATMNSANTSVEVANEKLDEYESFKNKVEKVNLQFKMCALEGLLARGDGFFKDLNIHDVVEKAFLIGDEATDKFFDGKNETEHIDVLN